MLNGKFVFTTCIKVKKINSIKNIVQCHMFSLLLHLLTFFMTADRKRLHGTDVLLINIIIFVFVVSNCPLSLIYCSTFNALISKGFRLRY